MNVRALGKVGLFQRHCLWSYH